MRSANSAGLQDLSTILIAAYGGEVCVDVNSQNAGTDIPIGTRKTPVNNLADAKLIADANGIHQIRILTSMTISSVDFSDGYSFTTDSPVTETLTFDPSANIRNCDFTNCRIQGTLDGNNIYRQCVLLNVTYTSGFVFQCSLNNTITLEPGAMLGALDCFSNTLAGEPNPAIDFNGSGQLLLRNYAGAIELNNHTSDDADGDVCIDMSSGVVIINASCTAGFMPVRGIADVRDFSTGTCDVRDLTVNGSVETNAASLNVINEGVKKASILIPHNADI